MKQYNVPALEKAIAIFDLLSASEGDLSVTEIHTALKIPKATIFMILNVLERFDMIKKYPNGKYAIGVKLFQLGMTYLTKTDLKKIARPYLEQLTRDTGFTSHLGTLVDDRVLFIDKVELNSFIKFSTFPGLRQDIHVTGLGKAIAAHLPEGELDGIIERVGLGRYTPNTITDPAKFKQVLGEIRKTGYTIEDEEGEIGVRCIGSPIFDSEGNVHAAVSITALRADLFSDVVPSVGKTVKITAMQISKELGYSPKGRDTT